MIAPAPVQLEGHGIRLEPLTDSHRQGLTTAASDGQLWKLWFTSVPEPAKTRRVHNRGARRPASGPHAALGGPGAGHRRDRRQHPVSRHRCTDRSSGDRLHLVRGSMAAHPRQHRVQAAAADPCVRATGLPGGRLSHRQLQLRVPEGHRRAGGPQGRRDPPSSRAARRQRARQRDVQHPGRRVARRETASDEAARLRPSG